MELAPGIRIIRIPEDMIGRVYSTNIYLVGDKKLVMVDVGDGTERHIRALFQYLLELGSECQIEQAVISHSHIGHCGGLRWMQETIGPNFRAHPAALSMLEKKGGKGLVRPLEDGDVLEADGIKLEVLFTPGHTQDSVSLFHREAGVLFSADTILGGSTTTIEDLSAFMNSMERLLRLRPRVIYSAHGTVIENGTQTIREYVEHRIKREQQIIEQLQRGPQTPQRLVQILYADVDKRLHRAARRNVNQHLQKLEREGLVRTEGSGVRTRYYWSG